MKYTRFELWKDQRLWPLDKFFAFMLEKEGEEGDRGNSDMQGLLYLAAFVLSGWLLQISLSYGNAAWMTFMVIVFAIEILLAAMRIFLFVKVQRTRRAKLVPFVIASMIVIPVVWFFILPAINATAAMWCTLILIVGAICVQRLWGIYQG